MYTLTMAGRAEHVSGESREPEAWRPAQLQRGYRRVLDRAKDRRQMILDTDGSMLVIEPKAQSDFAHELVKRLAEVAQFRAAYAAHAEVPASRWSGETPYPWLAAFDAGEVAEFARELVGFALDAAQRGSLEFFEGNLAAWRSTAEVYESPEQLEALLSGIDEGEIVELFPPSEEQARGAMVDAA